MSLDKQEFFSSFAPFNLSSEFAKFFSLLFNSDEVLLLSTKSDGAKNIRHC